MDLDDIGSEEKTAVALTFIQWRP